MMTPHTGKTNRLGNAKQSRTMGSLWLKLTALPLDVKCTMWSVYEISHGECYRCVMVNHVSCTETIMWLWSCVTIGTCTLWHNNHANYLYMWVFTLYYMTVLTSYVRDHAALLRVSANTDFPIPLKCLASGKSKESIEQLCPSKLQHYSC